MSTIEVKSTEHRAKTTQALAASGLAAGLMATSCCIFPLILVAAGVGGAWMSQLTALAPYQPLFLVASATALGFGFRRAYSSREDCAPGSLCQRPGTSGITKSMLWLGAAAVLAALGVNVIAPLIL